MPDATPQDPGTASSDPWQTGETPTPSPSPGPDGTTALPPAGTGADAWATQTGGDSAEAPFDPGNRSPVVGYEVLGELGRGGMGVVYKARQKGLNRPVALKMILSGEHASPQELARFATEAEAVARLQHPNIVQIYEIGEHRGLPYFSLEYCAGGNLLDRLASGRFVVAEAARLVETLARAVQAAHEQEIIHRDIKPANVLLTADGTPKIADFGLAKRIDQDTRRTQSGAVLGTPSYMAPEQAGGKGKQVGSATDVYALGAMLYELLSGQPPFQGDSAVDTVVRVLSEEPVPPRRLRPDLPRDLETICLKCLRKQPADRYASAAELADDLQRYTNREPIRARRQGLAERTVRWGKRQRGLAAVLLGVAAACAVLLVSSLLKGPVQGDPVGGVPTASGNVDDAGGLARKGDDQDAAVVVSVPRHDHYLAPACIAAEVSPCPQELTKIHALLVVDPASDLLKSVSVDGERMQLLLARNLPAGRCDVQVLSGDAATPQNILNYYEQLSVQPSDGLLFYYAGHGGGDPAQGPYLPFNAGKAGILLRSALRKAMQKKNPGLVVILTDTDAYNSPLPLAIQAATGSTPSVKGQPHKVKTEGDRVSPLLGCLLFRHRGLVDIIASLESNAFGDDDNGGIFTRTLCGLLARDLKEFDRNGDGFVSWEEFYPRLEEETDQTFQRWAAERRARGEQIGQSTQRPWFFTDKPHGPNFYGLAIGVNDYSKVKGLKAPNLACCRQDAESVYEVWQKQRESGLAAELDLMLLVDAQATRAAILAHLDEVARRVKTKDLFILALSGQGMADEEGKGSAKVKPGTFVFLCPDFDAKQRAKTGLTAQDLFAALGKIKCRKLLLVDAPNAGDLAEHPPEDLKDTVVLAACASHESAQESSGLRHGLFTLAVLDAFGERLPEADTDHNGVLDAQELFAFLKQRVPALTGDGEQHPECFPAQVPPWPLGKKVQVTPPPAPKPDDIYIFGPR